MAGEALAPTSNKPRSKQRLVVCLDGTWNNRDDCTNVLHAFNLVREGVMEDGVVQRRYYDEGVGTGVLDRLSGGGFGNGLEVNVRQAYDWLVQHYDDGDDVFVFGFSRGAFTARSLVGFIARCGLLLRGAPLTVKQLWQGYGELQREKEGTETFWDRTLRRAAFRQIEKLKSDPGVQPEWCAGDLNPTEELLVRWSRRIPIRFVGIFDTVGALGLDALAIPGLRGRAGRVHNVRPTSLVQRCCHALALDEHRSSFGHTPILQWLGGGTHGNVKHDGPDADRAPSERADWSADRTEWENESKGWRERWEQRWFVGAHSNVGGGYEDNPLATIPLAWLLQEAHDAKLVCDVPKVDATRPMPTHRDSYQEFVKPWWTWLVRGRRNYRPLAPGPELRASRARSEDGAMVRSGFVLEPINERIDASVWQFAAVHRDYAPPSLVAYAQQHAVGEAASVAQRPVEHEWPAPIAGGHLVIVAWAILAGVGWTYADDIFLVQPPHIVWIATGVSCFAGIVDWAESRLRLTLAMWRHNPAVVGGAGSARSPIAAAAVRAVTDALYWLRVAGVVFVVIGAVGLTWRFFSIGWRADVGYRDALAQGLEVLARWWPLPVLAVVTTILASIVDRWLGPVNAPRGTKPVKPTKPFSVLRAVDGCVGAGAAIITGCLALVVLGHTWRRMWTHVGDAPGPIVTEFPADVTYAGHFLLLAGLLACFVNTLIWSGEPMRRANLGSIVHIAGRVRRGMPLPPWFSGEQVRGVLQQWADGIRCWWDDPARSAPAAVRSIQRVAGETLWRDCLGLVPVYSLTFGFGLWFAAHDVGFTWLQTPIAGVPAWLAIVLVAAVADWTETLLHLGYLRRVDGSGSKFVAPPTPAVAIAGIATMVKLAAFATASATTVVAVGAAALALFRLDHAAGWRGFVGAIVVALVGVVVAWIGFSLWTARSQRRRNQRGRRALAVAANGARAVAPSEHR